MSVFFFLNEPHLILLSASQNISLLVTGSTSLRTTAVSQLPGIRLLLTFSSGLGHLSSQLSRLPMEVIIRPFLVHLKYSSKKFTFSSNYPRLLVEAEAVQGSD